MIKAQCFQYISYFGYLAIDRDLHGQHEARESVVVAAVDVNLRVRQEGADLREGKMDKLTTVHIAVAGRRGMIVDFDTWLHQLSTLLQQRNTYCSCPPVYTETHRVDVPAAARVEQRRAAEAVPGVHVAPS